MKNYLLENLRNFQWKICGEITIKIQHTKKFAFRFCDFEEKNTNFGFGQNILNASEMFKFQSLERQKKSKCLWQKVLPSLAVDMQCKAQIKISWTFLLYFWERKLVTNCFYSELILWKKNCKRMFFAVILWNILLQWFCCWKLLLLESIINFQLLCRMIRLGLWKLFYE